MPIISMIITSSVIAAIVSGVVSIISLYIQYKNSLKLDRHSTKQQLSLEIFKNLQHALEEIDNNGKMEISSENIDSIVDDAIIIMYERATEKAKVLESILLQVKYLISQERATYFSEKISDLDSIQKTLIASACHHKGLSQSDITIDVIPKDKIVETMCEYVDKTKELSVALEDEIVSVLRELLGT